MSATGSPSCPAGLRAQVCTTTSADQPGMRTCPRGTPRDASIGDAAPGCCVLTPSMRKSPSASISRVDRLARGRPRARSPWRSSDRSAASRRALRRSRSRCGSPRRRAAAEHGELARRGEEALRILGIDARLDRMAVDRDGASGRMSASRSPAAERIWAATRSTPVTLLGHAVLDLQPRVHLEEAELAVGAHQHLDRADVVVAQPARSLPATRLAVAAHALARDRRARALPR